MKNITPIILSSLFLLPAISTVQAAALSSHPSNNKSSNQIAQNIDPELQQLDQAQKQASTSVNPIAKDITVRISSANNGGSSIPIAKKGNTALDNNQRAIGDFERKIALDPQSAEAYYNRANAKFALGDKQGAIRDYDKAIAINPQDAEA